MGVTGLWEIIEGAAQSRSLAHLAIVEGFEGNRSGRRAYRLGIDASLWYQHATCIRDDGTKGANPHLRTLFFRLCKLTSYPLLPLFVFDGRERPKVKRGSKMGKSGSHNMTAKFKEMIDCFGWEWRMARGEAEAELAYLNSIGVIDAVVTDDVDALVFGATTLMRNPSLGLTGNRNNPATNSAGKASDKHYKVFTMENIRRHASIRLDRNGMILIALLAGGDYDKGVKRLGPIAAYALARLGFGERLVEAYRRGAAHLQATLPHWRDQLNQELHTNNSTLLPHRFPSITLDASFPNIALLEDYLNPICSAHSNLGAASLALRDRGDISLPRIAKFAEDHFDEWGHRSRLVYRLYDLLYEGAVVHVLRRAALEADEKERQTPRRFIVGTPASLVKKYLDPVKRNQQEDRLASAFARRDNYSSTERASTSAVAAADAPDPHPLVIEIERVRLSPDTDHIPEYRVLIDCNLLDSLTNKGIAGKHAELALTSAQAKAASSDNPVTRREQLRIWVAQSIMQRVHPDVVEKYQRKQAEKGNKKTTVGKGKGKRTAGEDDSEEDEEEMDNIDDLDLRSPAKSSRRRTRKNVAASVLAGPSIKPALDERPITPISTSQAREPTRPIMYRNVGIIKSEDPSNPYTFRFTYTNPDDPDMLILDEDEISNEVPPLPALPTSSIVFSATSASAVLPQPPTTPQRRNARATSSSQPPAPRRRKATQPRSSQATAHAAHALVEGLEAGPDEPMPMMFPAHEEDIIDRALGLVPTTPKKRGRPKANTDTRAAKRKRTQASATLGSNLPEMDDGNAGSQSRKRNNSSNAVKPSPSSSALSEKPRRQPAAFPEIPPIDNPGGPPPHKQTKDDVVDISSSEDEFQDLNQYGYQKRKNTRSSLLQFPSSSQDSDLYDVDAPSTSGRPKVAKPYGWRAGSEMPSSSMSDAFLDDVQFTFDLT